MTGIKIKLQCHNELKKYDINKWMNELGQNEEHAIMKGKMAMGLIGMEERTSGTIKINGIDSGEII